MKLISKDTRHNLESFSNSKHTLHSIISMDTDSHTHILHKIYKVMSRLITLNLPSHFC